MIDEVKQGVVAADPAFFSMWREVFAANGVDLSPMSDESLVNVFSQLGDRLMSAGVTGPLSSIARAGAASVFPNAFSPPPVQLRGLRQPPAFEQELIGAPAHQTPASGERFTHDETQDFEPEVPPVDVLAEQAKQDAAAARQAKIDTFRQVIGGAGLWLAGKIEAAAERFSTPKLTDMPLVQQVGLLGDPTIPSAAALSEWIEVPTPETLAELFPGLGKTVAQGVGLVRPVPVEISPELQAELDKSRADWARRDQERQALVKAIEEKAAGPIQVTLTDATLHQYTLEIERITGLRVEVQFPHQPGKKATLVAAGSIADVAKQLAKAFSLTIDVVYETDRVVFRPGLGR